MPYNVQEATPDELSRAGSRGSKYDDHELAPYLKRTRESGGVAKVVCQSEDERDALLRDIKGVAKALGIGYRANVKDLTVIFAGRDKKSYTLSPEGRKRRAEGIRKAAEAKRAAKGGGKAKASR